MTNHHVPPYLSDSLPGQAGWPIGLAHRGADVQRENTMGAVRAAVEQGFGYIEVDVRASADGKVVVFHDEQLDRITTGSGKLSDHTWDELSTLTVSGPRPRYESVAEPLVLFEQLLETFPAVRFNVDLKDRQSAAPMVEIVRRHNAWGRVLIASFQDSHRLLFFAKVKAGEPTVASSAGVAPVALLLLTHRFFGFTTVTRWLRKRLPLHALQVPVRRGPLRVVTRRFVEACHSEGIALHVWVVNDQDEMQRLLAMGVDGIVTDNGTALARVLGARGQWPQRP